MAPPNIIIKTVTISKFFRVLFPKRLDWSGEWPFIRSPNSFVFFTDGSKIIKELSGVGFFCSDLQLETTILLGSYISALQAEIFGISKAVRICLTLGLQG